MGVELFVRTKRSVLLTPAGHVFLERVRALFDATVEAVNAARTYVPTWLNQARPNYETPCLDAGNIRLRSA
jgi:DNA-binding transcriptional LysR family regulator